MIAMVENTHTELLWYQVVEKLFSTGCRFPDVIKHS